MSQIKINPQSILDMLAQGMTREEIRESLGLTKRDLKLMFQHPELKGKKTLAKPAFVFVDNAGNETNPLDFHANVEEEEEVTDVEEQVETTEEVEETAPAETVEEEESPFETSSPTQTGPTDEAIRDWDAV